MRNYGQVIHKIIQRGNRNMATVSKDVTLYGFWASSGTFYPLPPHVATIQPSDPDGTNLRVITKSDMESPGSPGL